VACEGSQIGAQEGSSRCPEELQIGAQGLSLGGSCPERAQIGAQGGPDAGEVSDRVWDVDEAMLDLEAPG
jgi:hypothetical protein